MDRANFNWIPSSTVHDQINSCAKFDCGLAIIIIIRYIVFGVAAALQYNILVHLWSHYDNIMNIYNIESIKWVIKRNRHIIGMQINSLLTQFN